MPSFEQLMRLREGVRSEVHLNAGKKRTVGIGHLVRASDKLKLGDCISDKQIASFFKADGGKAVAAAKSQAAKAGIKSPQFVVYLAAVNFQLGKQWTRLLKTPWQMILDGKYADAAEALQGSKWQKQTPKRVKDFQKALLKLPEKKA